MVYLVDTQIVIWFLLFDNNLTPPIYDLLIDTNNSILVSQVSLFEIAIKQTIGKLPELDKSISELTTIITNDGFDILPLQNEHLAEYSTVPLLPNHKDPFDRLIIATAISEGLPIISADEKFSLYQNLVTLIKA
ncbi:type II toxin-antitoxin system VapC family toxin [Runella limosa]|uniref:type II toxin-antitoxin system VapC family toxin n=1 Tax=Runella limosa TaxID=370978 RepID=UPI00041BF898|nr:type II toxin-antitoxin system VapC family toxin [Runella limosa]